MSHGAAAFGLSVEILRDPSHFRDNRSRKRNRNSPDFRHIQARSPLWIDGQNNPPRLEDQLGILYLNTKKRYHDSNKDNDDDKTDRAHFRDRKSVMQLMKLYGKQRNVNEARKLHSEMRKLIPKQDIYISTALLSMLAKCGALNEAQEIFENLPYRNIVSWNALIAGYAQYGHFDASLECLKHMRNEGISPDSVTFKCLVKGCASTGSLEIGEEIHAEVKKLDLLEKDIGLGTTLVDMYAKCGALGRAQELFEELPEKDVVSWNVLISGYAHRGDGNAALNCFRRMSDEGVSPSSVTFISALKACGMVGSLEMGQFIHEEIKKKGLLEKDIMLGNTLVDMYAKCGMLGKAFAVFHKLPKRDVVSWNALITGYTQHGHDDSALECFREMVDKGVTPNIVTFTCALKVCGSIGALEIGEEIHVTAKKQTLLEKDIMLGNTLVDMYAKCGVLDKAQDVFEEIPKRDIVSWNALIAGYAQMSQANRVFCLFHKMRKDGIVPDVVTFLIRLSVCSHAGLVEEAADTFDDLCNGYHLTPLLQHYTCMIDIFGRAGCFDKAIAILDQVPSLDYLPLLLAMLGACRKWANVELGRWSFEKVMELDGKCTPAYVCMRNIYDAAGMHEEAAKLESSRRAIRGCCQWTNVNGNVYSFIGGEMIHHQSACIYAKLEDIRQKLIQYGYSLPLCWSQQHLPVANEKDMLCNHSEKLAIACALLNTQEQIPIHVTKNMGVCVDCHHVTSLISKIERRKVYVQAGNRIHIFEDGRCTCKDQYDSICNIRTQS